MADYKIRWKQADYIKLGKAVASFNKKIREVKNEENKLYLPEEIDYKDIKSDILTRKELNRVLNSLKRFQEKDATNLRKTQGGEEITNWEYKELVKQKRIAVKQIISKLNEIEKATPSNFSVLQMGNINALRLQGQLKDIEEFEKATDKKFKSLKNKIQRLGTFSYDLKKARIYQENFMEELENLKASFPEFDKVYEYFKSIKNPTKFYETTQKSQALQDFFEWYKSPEGYADFTAEELADEILSNYGIGV